jgi:hypothetical protein
VGVELVPVARGKRSHRGRLRICLMLIKDIKIVGLRMATGMERWIRGLDPSSASGVAVQFRYAEYRRASRWHRAWEYLQPFRSVSLNLVGWTVVVLVLLAGGAAGYGGSRLVDLPSALGAIAGSAGVLAVLLVVDRRRWSRTLDG